MSMPTPRPPLVDVHAHLGTAQPGAPPPDELARYAEKCGLDLVLCANRDAAGGPGGADVHEADANMACVVASRTLPRLGALYRVRPGRPDSNLYVLAGAVRTEGLAGLAFAPGEDGLDAADKRLDGAMLVAAQVRRPAVFYLTGDGGSAAERVYELARRHARVAVVMCICASGVRQRAAALEVVRHAQKRSTADLYLDTAHAPPEEVFGLVRAVGAERVLLGTDALAYGADHANHVERLLAALRGQLPAGDFERVAGGNAARLFPLQPRVPQPV